MNSENELAAIHGLAKMIADVHESIRALRNELAAARAGHERAVQEEREACAKLAEEWDINRYRSVEEDTYGIAAAIRARGTTKEGLTT